MLQGEHSAILLTCIKLPFVIKTFVLSFFEWPFYTGFTVCCTCTCNLLGLGVFNIVKCGSALCTVPKTFDPNTRACFFSHLCWSTVAQLVEQTC